MKKTVASLFLIFLTSCQIINNEKAQNSVDTFDVNDGCPYICWLGINPGKTTAAEAKQIIILINLNWLTLCPVMLSEAKHLYG